MRYMPAGKIAGHDTPVESCVVNLGIVHHDGVLLVELPTPNVFSFVG